MRDRTVRGLFGAAVGLLLAVGLFAAGVATGLTVPWVQGLVQGRLGPAPEEPAAAVMSTPSPVAPDGALNELFAPFWQAWGILHDKFVDQPLDDSLLMQGAIRGLVDALDDPNSSYMDPGEYEQANMPLDGSYEGIGAWVDTDGSFLTIIAPMPDSPAEQAGLHPGDVVVGIDGEDMIGVDPSLVVQRILGPAGTTVRLTILREGVAEAFDVEVARARIELPDVESRMLEEGIAYVRLYTFGAGTARELHSSLEDLMAESPRGLILDLRGNGGGYLSTALQVTSEFVGDGVIMVERYGDGREETQRAEEGGLATDVPLIVLIDGGSASASEIVAGAIQDLGRGRLVGDTSFGKGSVQEWVALAADAGAIRVTVARWLTPNGRQIDEVGLTPDVQASLTEEDVQAGLDPQLDRAVELLIAEAAE